ncbi:hemicentin-2-like [Mytilus edulis]|uniref:hemicentin-2-like n=1 Tax=Mytilus edulis TaxID=6550 RepID=UPI0039F0BC52
MVKTTITSSIMKYTSMVGHVLVCVYFKAFQITYSVTISGSGSYIIPNKYYELTCSYDTFKEDRRTTYNFLDDKSNGIYSLTVRYVNTTEVCSYGSSILNLCSAVNFCSCDRYGMATRIYYNLTSNIRGLLTVSCFAGDNSLITIPVAVGPDDSMNLIPPSSYHTKTLGESLGPITCSASCYPECQYEWTMQSRATMRGSTLHIESLTKEDDGIYSCKAWNEVYTSGKSITLNLTVNYGPESVSLSPLDTQYTVTEGMEQISITCTADCKPACNYIWSGPDVPVWIGNVLILRNITKNQRGVFKCTASNKVGSFNSHDVNIDVQFGPGSSMQFEQSNTAVTKNKGDTLGPIICAATCNPSCQYKWTKLDKTVIEDARLMLASLSIEDHGQFTCTASNDIGSVNKRLDVIVNYGPIAVKLLPATQQYTVDYGETIPAITCSANCRPDCKYTWSGPNVASGVLNVLSLHTIQKHQNGDYQCRASNDIGSMQSSIINVNVQFGPGSSIQLHPSDMSVTKKEGNKLGPIDCEATCNPPCQYKWTKPDKTIIYNRELMIESLSIDDHGTFICTASNKLGDGNNNLDVTVNYGPAAVILSPSTKQYIVTNGQTIAPINCSANCRPECSHMWSGPNVPSGAVNILHLEHIQKNQSGDFQCQASNKVGSVQSTIINVNVQYSPFVNNVSINGSNFIVNENTTAILSCNFDGNPAPQNTWEKNNQILSDEDENKQRSYKIQPVRCEDTGNYSCVANNSIGMSSAQQSMFVTCSPRLNLEVEQPSTKIGLSTGTNLSLTVNLIAYPSPTSTLWFFKDIEGNETTIPSNLKTFELFKHVVFLRKTNLTKSDFGDYILKVNNTLGASIQTFHVIPQGPPDPTFILNVSCGIQTAKLFWLSSFNGGDIQKFSILVQKKEKNIYLHETDINDQDGKNIKFESIKLSAGEYLFQIYGNNKYGNRTSTNSKLCQVKDLKMSVFDPLIGVAAGGGSVVILVAIVLVILMKKRRIFRGGDKEMIKRCSRTTDEDDDGLKDNPLYVTSGDVVNGDIGPVYGVVNKQKQNKNTLLADEGNDEGQVYSQVQKSNIKGKKKLKKKKIDKASLNENDTEIELGTVYENYEKEFKQTNTDEIYANGAKHDDGANISKAYSPRKNKDGLTYADVDFVPGPSGKRFVIRGLENRTNYAIIDLTQKAEPLSSDSEDEDEDKNYANVDM